jgi:hypothetical protein
MGNPALSRMDDEPLLGSENCLHEQEPTYVHEIRIFNVQQNQLKHRNSGVLYSS